MTSEVVKIEELPDGAGWLEFYSDGRIRAKNAEGQLMKHERNYTPSKVASELGKLGAQKALDTTGEIADLLQYLGLDSPFDMQLAKVLVDGKAQSVAAAKELLKAAQTRGSFKSEHKQHDIKAGGLYWARKTDDDVELVPVDYNELGMQKLRDYIQEKRQEEPSNYVRL